MSSNEIAPVDSTDVFLDMDPILPEDSPPTSLFTRPLALKEQYVWEPYDSEKLPETLASGIQRFLRVANLVESDDPRVAYLCEFTLLSSNSLNLSTTLGFSLFLSRNSRFLVKES